MAGELNLKNELSQLRNELNKTISKTEELEQSTRELNGIIKQGETSQKKLSQASRQLTQNEKELQKASKQLENQRQRALKTQAKQEHEQREMNRIMREGAKSIEEARFANKKLRQERDKLNVTTQQGQKRAKEYNAAIDKNNKFIKQNSDAHTRTKMSIGEYAKGVQSALLTVTAYAAAIYGVIRGFIELSRITLETSKQNSQIASSFGITRDQADGMRAQVVSLAKTMGDEYKNVLKATTVLQKEFGLTAQESLDLVEEGFRKGANVNGEFLEQLKEYPAQLRSVGFSARESIAIIAETENQGIYSDKGIDAIKEAGLRLRENTKAVQEALSPLDEQLQAQIQTEIAAGNTFEAIKLISGELNNSERSASEVQTIIADVFGGAGEDAGLRYLQALKDINLNLDEIDTTLSDAEISQRELNLAVEELKTAYLSGEGAITGFFTKVREALAGLINQLIQLREGGGAIAATFQALFSTIAINFKIAGQLIETFIIRPLKLVGQVSKAVFERDFGAIPGIIKQGLKEGKDDIVNFGLDVVDTAKKVRDAFKGTGETISAESKVAGFATKKNIGGAIDEVDEKAQKFWEKYGESVDKIKQKLDDFYNTQKQISSLSDLQSQNQGATDDIFKEQESEEKSIYDDINDAIDENLEKEEEANERKLELIEQELEARRQLKDQGVQLINEVFEFGNATREAELQSIRQKVEAGVLTEEAGAKREKSILREQARAEKQQALFNAIINVAEAVAKFGLITPQAILAGIIGAVQIAKIVAQPIPQFFKGVEDFEGGPAWVGEKGFERLDMPGVGTMISPDKPTLMNLPRGTDVYPHYETVQMMQEGMQPGHIDRIVDSNKRVEKALSKMTIHNTMITKEGWEWSTQRGNTKLKWKNKYFG